MKGIHFKAALLSAAFMSAAAGFAQNNIQVSVNGQPVAFDQARPQMVGGRVLVPLRGVMEQLGAYVQWDASTHTVTATKAGTDIQLRIGDRSATVNGQPVTLDVPAMVVGGSTMVPLRFMGESLGADVRWDTSTSTVAINTANNAAVNANNYSPPTQVNTQVVKVTSFMHNANGWLTPNHPVHFTLDGTPGGQATLYVPGVTGEIPMQETSPGHYEADWTPPFTNGQPISIKDAAPIAKLTVNGQQQFIQAKSDLQLDTEAPVIRTTYPVPNTVLTARPQIMATFDDAGSGVDSSRVRLLFDGADVTNQATVNAGFISYTPNYELGAGPHTVDLFVPDKAGNMAHSKWTFTATGATGTSSLTFVAPTVLQPGQPITFSMTAPPGSQVSVAIAHKVNVPLTETSPGVFTGTYLVRGNDIFENDPVGARVITPNGQTYYVQASQHLGYTTTSVTATTPMITSPVPSQMVTDPLVVTGTAPPNSTVLVHVDYATSLLGALRVNGAVADVTTTADASGNFTTRPISLGGFMKGSNTQYTITAYTMLPNGSRSNAATMTVRG